MPEATKVTIKRVKGKPPATCISYPEGGGLSQWHPEPEKTEFDVSPIVAYFAIQEGFFEQSPKSKTRLKVVGDVVTSIVEEQPAESPNDPEKASK